MFSKLTPILATLFHNNVWFICLYFSDILTYKTKTFIYRSGTIIFCNPKQPLRCLMTLQLEFTEKLNNKKNYTHGLFKCKTSLVGDDLLSYAHT